MRFRSLNVGPLALAILLSASLGSRAVFGHEGEDDGDGFITGVLYVIQEDDFERGKSKRHYFVQDPETGELTRVRFERRPSHKLVTGAKVKLKGRRDGDEVVVPAGGGGSFQIVEAAAALVAGDQHTLVIAINLLDKSLSCSVADIESLMFSGQLSVNGLYEETSYGNVTFSGDVVGPYTINYNSSSCSYSAWASAAEAAAQAEGVNVSQYNRRVYVFPNGTACGWAGLGTVGGNPSKSWIAYCNYPDVYAHELGHNLTMHHASTDTNNDSVNDCEYCDTSDIMGYGGAGWRQVNAPHKHQMGWLTSNEVVNVTGSGTFTLAPLEYYPWTTTYPQALKIPRAGTSDYYYFSYRRAVGYDYALSTSYRDKLSVHHYAGSGAIQTFFVQALSDGQSFEDPSVGLSVMQLNHGNDYVTVQVSFGGGCAPAAPTETISPSSRMTAAGSTVSYSVNLTNRDGAGCPSTTFQISSVVPAGWTVSPTSTLTLGPGTTGSATISVTPPNGTSDGNYSLAVNVTDALEPAHNVSAGALCTVDSTPPSTVNSLTAALKRKNKAELSWAESIDGGSGTKGYDIYRSTGGSYARIATTTNATYTDAGLSSGVTYSYYVVAFDAVGNRSGAGNIASVSTGGGSGGGGRGKGKR